MSLKRRIALIAAVAVLGFMAYVAAPKHPPTIVERTVNGFTQIDSGWSRLLGTKEDEVVDWRAQVNCNPAKPPFVILLRSQKSFPWTHENPGVTLVSGDRRSTLFGRRAQLLEGESIQATFLTCTGTRDDLAALAESAQASIEIDGIICSFGTAGSPQFRELHRRSKLLGSR